MRDYKKDFPIFQNNPELIYLDNAASTQKPKFVIDWIKNFLENDYANIHRGSYSLSEKSEELYEKSKKKVAEFIGAEFASEINYTYNANYAFNIIAQTLKKSEILKKWDKVILGISEHHANIVPWLILKEEIWIEIDYVWIRDDFSLDLEDLKSKLTSEVKVVSLSYASNVTGQIFELEKVWEIIKNFNESVISSLIENSEKIIKNTGFPLPREWEENQKLQIKKISENNSALNSQLSTLFIVDASQAVPNFKVDVKKLNCDFLVFTAHKVMAETGLGIFYIKKELAKKLIPSFGWGWAINRVKEQEFSPAGLPNKFEPGTPNIIWAVSLLKALEYIESIGWYEAIEKNEKELIEYFLQKLEKYNNCHSEWNKESLYRNLKIELIGSKKLENRLWIFSLVITGFHITDLAEFFAKENICVRAWLHCAEPLANCINNSWSLRISLYLYNDKNDIDRFFEVLDKILNKKIW